MALAVSNTPNTSPSPQLPWCPSGKTDVKTSSQDICILVVSIALFVIGILWVAGVFTLSGNQGVILPGISFGASVEGGFCIGLATFGAALAISRMISPRIRTHVLW